MPAIPRVALCVLATLSTLQAAVLRVPSEYPSIGAAMHRAQENDTILLARGFYREQVTLIDRVTLRGEHRDSTIIIGRENRPVILGANHAVVSNLTIKNGSVGIRCENKTMVIEHNVITENRESGIHCLVTLPVIRSNIIARNAWSGILCQSAHGLNAVIEHNVIAENRYSGIVLAGRSEVIIRNNIICYNGQYGVFAERESRRARIEFNNFHHNRHLANQYAVITASNHTVDPAFIAIRADVYDYAAGPRASFTHMGRDGAGIGLLSAATPDARADDHDDDMPDNSEECPERPQSVNGFTDEDGGADEAPRD